jgi:hypothetical protein
MIKKTTCLTCKGMKKLSTMPLDPLIYEFDLLLKTKNSHCSMALLEVEQYIDCINREALQYAYRVVRYVSRCEYIVLNLRWQSTYDLISTYFTLFFI